MHIVTVYKSQRGPNQPGFQRTGEQIDGFRDATSARAEAEAYSRKYSHNGYNGEKDYFWGWNDDSIDIYYFSVQPDPMDAIAGGAIRA